MHLGKDIIGLLKCVEIYREDLATISPKGSRFLFA